jgi:hypothetical protein
MILFITFRDKDFAKTKKKRAFYVKTTSDYPLDLIR